jgi:hypothetical protein
VDHRLRQEVQGLAAEVDDVVRADGIADIAMRRPPLWSGSTWLTTMRSTFAGSMTLDTRAMSSLTNGRLTVSISATLSLPTTRYAL